MKTFLLVSFLTLSAAAQPVVTSISPSSGPDAGGTEVRITGSHMVQTIICALPCPPQVTFGTTTVDAFSESDSVLIATTPPHVAGTVDVTVHVPGVGETVVPGGFTFIQSPQSTYEQVLLPVYITGVINGANGTQWTTDFWIRNDGTEPVSLAPWTCPADTVCPGVFPLTFPLQAQLSLHNPPRLSTEGRSNPSQLLYLFKTPEPSVSMGLRVADVSRQELNAGTNVPVIREGDLLTAPAQLLNVPLDRSSRALLRIYDLTFQSAQFVVTVYPQGENIEPPVYSKSLSATTTQTGTFRNEAAYAQLDLAGLLPAEGIARVQVRPVSPGSRYWTFVSITNNQTQLVTLVTP